MKSELSIKIFVFFFYESIEQGTMFGVIGH